MRKCWSLFERFGQVRIWVWICLSSLMFLHSWTKLEIVIFNVFFRCWVSFIFSAYGWAMARKPSMMLINYLYVTIRKPNVRNIWHFMSQNVLHREMLLLSIANSKKKKTNVLLCLSLYSSP